MRAVFIRMPLNLSPRPTLPSCTMHLHLHLTVTSQPCTSYYQPLIYLLRVPDQSMNSFPFLVAAFIHPCTLLATTVFVQDQVLLPKERWFLFAFSFVLWILQLLFWILCITGARSSFVTITYLFTICGGQWTEVSNHPTILEVSLMCDSFLGLGSPHGSFRLLRYLCGFSC